MKRAILTVTAIFMTLSAMAFETKVQTKSVGEVTISSKDKMWSIDAKLEQKGEPTDVEEYFSGISLVDPHRVAHKEEHTWMYRYEHSEAKVRIDAFLAKFKKSNKNK